jgi:hypothetical protein
MALCVEHALKTHTHLEQHAEHRTEVSYTAQISEPQGQRVRPTIGDRAEALATVRTKLRERSPPGGKHKYNSRRRGILKGNHPECEGLPRRSSISSLRCSPGSDSFGVLICIVL